MDGVTASSTGRNELDLMKLIIEKQGDHPEPCDKKIKLEYQGNEAKQRNTYSHPADSSLLIIF